MATIGSASKRSVIVGIILVVVAGCTGSTTSSSAPSEPTTAPPTSSPDAVQAVTDTLNGGLYRFGPFGDSPSFSIVATGPDRWVGYPDWAMDGPEPVRADAPKGIGLSFFSADSVFSDPCHWDWKGTGQADVGDVKVGPSVDAMVTALRAVTYYTSTAPKPVTIDGYSGKELELQMPDGSYANCDNDDPNDSGGHVFVFGGPGLYTQGPANHWHLFILNVHGERLIAVTLSYAKTPRKDVDTANNVIKTMKIEA